METEQEEMAGSYSVFCNIIFLSLPFWSSYDGAHNFSKTYQAVFNGNLKKFQLPVDKAELDLLDRMMRKKTGN